MQAGGRDICIEPYRMGGGSFSYMLAGDAGRGCDNNNTVSCNFPQYSQRRKDTERKAPILILDNFNNFREGG